MIRRKCFWKRLCRWGLLALLLFLGMTVSQVALLRVVDPPSSAFMLARQWQALRSGEKDFRLQYEWRDMERIASGLPLAVIAAEDQRFVEHNGFDFEAIEKARVHNARGDRIRGASTISQQLAKNLFLWQGRNWIRKGLEAWYTVLIEWLLPKRRILEIYLNVVEFGDGIYGAQAAAQAFWGKDASGLSDAESARLAAVLPAPKRYDAAHPSAYVQRREAWIRGQMRQLGGAVYLRKLQ